MRAGSDRTAGVTTHPYAAAVLRNQCAEVAAAPVGTRNGVLNTAALKVGHFVPAYINERDAIAQLVASGLAAGLEERETHNTVASGLGKGMAEPRTIPNPAVQLVPEVDADGVIRPNQITPLILTTRQLAEYPEPEPLIPDHLYRNTLTWIGGAPGAYKSFLAVEIAATIATGTTWRGHKVKPGRVLYVAAEGQTGIHKRVEAWQQATGVNAAIDWLTTAPQIGTAIWEDLIAHVAATGYDLIILDTQSRITVGAEENDASAATRLIDQLTRLKNASGACVVIVHHLNRAATNLRGSSVIDAAADTIIELVKVDGTTRVKNRKQKDTPEFADYYIRGADTGRSMVLVECEKPATWSGRFKALRRGEE